MLNWAVKRGTIPIPRSGSSNHVQENIEIYDFHLSAEDIAFLDGLDKNLRICDKLSITGNIKFFVWAQPSEIYLNQLKLN